MLHIRAYLDESFGIYPVRQPLQCRPFSIAFDNHLWQVTVSLCEIVYTFPEIFHFFPHTPFDDILDSECRIRRTKTTQNSLNQIVIQK